MTRAIWQISGGPANRDYADILIKHGVALIGPGDSGPWTPDRDEADFGDSVVRRFAIETQLGDVFLLRTGLSSIRAVGLVASDYLYLPQFDDVNGLDLQHARRVRWCSLPGEYDFGARVFGTSAFAQVNDPDIVDYAERFIASPPIPSAGRPRRCPRCPSKSRHWMMCRCFCERSWRKCKTWPICTGIVLPLASIPPRTSCWRIT